MDSSLTHYPPDCLRNDGQADHIRMSQNLSTFPSTQADQVAERVRADILSCRLAPGSKIRIGRIVEQMGVTKGAVREGLSRLAAAGMTIAIAQRGFIVAPVSIEELSDLTTTRVTIEQVCLREALRLGELDWETRLVAATHRLLRLDEIDPSDGVSLSEHWAQAHGDFHLALVAGCRSLSLLRIRNGLYAETERYRRLSVPYRDIARDVNAEHRALTDAALDRDADKVCELIAAHFWCTTDILLRSPLLIRTE